MDQHTEFFSYIQFSSPYCIFPYCTKNISPTSTAKISVTFNRVYFWGKIFGQDVLNFMTLLQSIDFILTLVNIIIRQHCPLAIIATFVDCYTVGNWHWIIIKYVPFGKLEIPHYQKRSLSHQISSIQKSTNFDNF